MRLLTLKEREELYTRRILKICRGSITEAVRILGIGRATLYRRLAAMGIDKHGRRLPSTELSEQAVSR